MRLFRERAMNRLPPLAKLYWGAVVVVGTAAVVLSQVLPLPTSKQSPWEVGAFALLALLSGGQKFDLKKLRSDDEGMSMTLGTSFSRASIKVRKQSPDQP